MFRQVIPGTFFDLPDFNYKSVFFILFYNFFFLLNGHDTSDASYCYLTITFSQLCDNSDELACKALPIEGPRAHSGVKGGCTPPSSSRLSFNFTTLSFL